MDKIAKFLKKLPPKKRKTLLSKVDRLINRDIVSLDIMKIKSTGYFRLRSGNIRLFFYYDNGFFKVDSVGFRKSKTYKNIIKRN